MAVAIRMPKMSDTMTEGVIAEWLKKVGDTVKSGDIIAEVETDKATMELENYEDGVILYIGIEKGQAVPVDGVIAVIGAAGEDYKSALGGGAAPAPAVAETAPAAVASEPAPVAAAPAANVNAAVVRMPKMSDTMTEGVIAEWLKKVGDVVKSGDIIAEVETDKATMELENYEDGTILYIGAEKGQAVPVDGIIAIVGEAGADYKALLGGGAPAAAPATAAPAETAAPVASAPAAASATPAADTDGRVKASPLAKALAKDKGINLSEINGSGENGRIIKADVDNFKPKAEAAPAAKSAPAVASPAVYGEESYEEFPVSQMRKTIARRLSESKFTAPEFYLTMEINMDKAMAARTSMNEISPVKISFNDMVIKAVAQSLTKHPKVNSSWLGDKIRVNKHVHIGMAVAVEEGLLVPVIRFANTKSLSQISADAKDLGGKAKNKQLQPKDWEGNTFTVSNLGMFGIDEFTSIINSPESCILAVGGIKETVGVKNGQFYATNVMKVTLTCDHRTVDGATGAAFLQTFKQLLEDPYKLLV
ncbi:pyruvate dehydrogenase E2 component (dihydrolipoamide acetyltransferase) [Pseudarcicella hirudinis]|uniref:Acetyltransferase component of pyruvate dehydrogenase complex n=1 Tax=Pseudarcicella hirudinis TaxID=1079859 RepID=A0A1I5W9B2_9BACT|nr:pyruvate dehydrogenase complex dihydrolipoamide acetyltransferase [Pseudarcicella hirudinis]SFQ16332.1 pyruvate dehydrogenase E2 component (dihydrolipoamide acetyltransferase) [Pseudarcicella hirudinis]